jgi:hypothetical protein
LTFLGSLMSPGQSGALPDSSRGHVYRLSNFCRQCVPADRPIITRTVRHITSCTTVSCPHLGTPTLGRLSTLHRVEVTDRPNFHSHSHSLTLSSPLSLQFIPLTLSRTHQEHKGEGSPLLFLSSLLT